MGIFGKSEEEKGQAESKRLEEQQKKINEALKVLGVDFNSASDEELLDSNNKNVLTIRTGMPNNLTSEIIIAAGLKNFERLSLMKLTDITAQNWILIRQNEILTRYLKKIHDVLKTK